MLGLDGDPRIFPRPSIIRRPISKPVSEEAAAIDARNRERLEEGRTGRFEPFLTGEEQQARARRGTSKR